MKYLLIAAVLVSGFAHAGDVYVQVQPNNDWFSQDLAQKRQQNIEAMSRSIQGVQASLVARKTVTNSVLVVNCGKATNLVRTFQDGHMEQTDMGGKNVSAMDLATIQASLPALKIVQGCE